MGRLGTGIALLLGELDRGTDFAAAAARLGVRANELEESLSRRIKQP